MNFKEYKRKSFFLLDKLQISKTERVAITLLLVILTVLISFSFLLQETYNYKQENYDDITAEFLRKSALIHQQKKETAQKYNSEIAVKEQTLIKETETSAPTVVEKISINTAGIDELKTLKGVGDAYARRIIEYRKANGGFSSVDDLIKVKGIGEKRLEAIRPFITL